MRAPFGLALVAIVALLLNSCLARQAFLATSPAVFFEDFEDNSRGWVAYDGAGNERPPTLHDSALHSDSPWWIDYNHAPPGAGYLHILGALHTYKTGPWGALNLPTDFTNARVTMRLRGELEDRDAKLMMLIQATNGAVNGNFVLVDQPFEVTPDWSEQTITLVPDESQWTCLGSREDRKDTYGCFDVVDALKDMNVDFIFVLFPLNIEPIDPDIDPHALRAGTQYEVNRTLLPEGHVAIDWVRVQFDDQD